MALPVTKNSFAALASVCSHNADDDVVAFAFYNVGILDTELQGAKIKKKAKRERLETDIKATFTGYTAIQALFLCEFGNMMTNYHGNTGEQTLFTEQIFKELLCDIDMSHLVVHALPPYIAIVDPNYWDVNECYYLGNLCTMEHHFAMMLSLEHVQSRAKIGVANCHIPSSTGSRQRRTDTIVALCKELATLNNLSGWIIGGDCNLDENTMKRTCLAYLEHDVPCISRSGGDMTEARKADFAITRGIDLQEVDSWVGFNFGSHVSDQHNMVPVIGTVRSYACEPVHEEETQAVVSTALPSSNSLHFAAHKRGADVVPQAFVSSAPQMLSPQCVEAAYKTELPEAEVVPLQPATGAFVRSYACEPVHEEETQAVVSTALPSSNSLHFAAHEGGADVVPQAFVSSAPQMLSPQCVAAAYKTELPAAEVVPLQPATVACVRSYACEPVHEEETQAVVSTALPSSNSLHFAAHEGGADVVPQAFVSSAPTMLLPQCVAAAYKTELPEAEVVPLQPATVARMALSAAEVVPLQLVTAAGDASHAADPFDAGGYVTLQTEPAHEAVTQVVCPAAPARHDISRMVASVSHAAPPVPSAHEAVNQVVAPIVLNNSDSSYGAPPGLSPARYNAAGLELLQILGDMADNEDETASNLVDSIISCHDGRAVKSPEQILTFFADVSERRKACIEIVAQSRGVEHSTRWGEYTRDEWRGWLQENPFDEHDMTENVAKWKEDFQRNDFEQQEKVAKWRKENTRESKKQAQAMVNGAWKTHLAEKYGTRGRQLAMAFLKCPSTNVYSLLSQWREYLQSTEYKEERERSRKGRPKEQKQNEKAAKVKVYFLRHQRRQCTRLDRRLADGTITQVPYAQKGVYASYLDGSLDKELDDATNAHGYGNLSTGRQIGAFGAKYH